MTELTPQQAWQTLREGNARFVAGDLEHPRQGSDDRDRLVGGQQPPTVLLGCSDSRVPAEIVFDQGLGDIFVVRTAGQVLDPAVLGSLEYATEVAGVALLVVLGHEGCGAVKAGLAALDDRQVPGGYIRDLVADVSLSLVTGRDEGLTSVADLTARHVTETARMITGRSKAIAERVTNGGLAIAGATYSLSSGAVSLCYADGDLGELPAA